MLFGMQRDWWYQSWNGGNRGWGRRNCWDHDVVLGDVGDVAVGLESRNHLVMYVKSFNVSA